MSKPAPPHTRTPGRREAAPPHPSRSPAPPAAPAGEGKLTFDTVPWTDVYDGARKIGTTPLVEWPLAAGHHRLHLMNSDAHIDRYYDVDVPVDQNVSVPRVRL